MTNNQSYSINFLDPSGVEVVRLQPENKVSDCRQAT